MKLTIDNFRGIEHFEAEFPGKILALTGPSGSGKSSILRAIRFLFTGDVNDRIIRKGSSNAKVELVFTDGDKLSRSREPGRTKCRINGKATTLKAVDEFLVKETGAPAAAYEAVMGCDFLKDMDTKDMSSFLMSILPLSTDIETVMKYCRMLQPELDADTEHVIRKMLPEENISFPAIAKAYNTLFENRTVQNRIVNDLRAKVSVPPQKLPQETMEQLEARSYEIAEMEVRKKQAEQALKDYETAKKAYDSATERKSAIQKELEKYKEVQRPEKQILEQNISDRQKFYDAVSKTESALAALNSNTELLQKTLATLDQPVCPLSEKLHCTTDKSPLKKEIEAGIAANLTTKAGWENFLQRCRDQIAMRDRAIEDFHKAELLYNQKVSLEKQLEQLVIPNLPQAPSVNSQTIDIETLKQEIGAKKRAILAQEEYRKNLDNLEKERALAAKYDRAVLLLDAKTGIPAKIMSAAFSSLADACNKKLTALKSSLSISFKEANGITILVKPENASEPITLQDLSSGESILVIYTLMCLSAEISGIRYLMIDDLNALDKEKAAALIHLLEADDTFSYVFLGTVNHYEIKKALEASTATVISMK